MTRRSILNAAVALGLGAGLSALAPVRAQSREDILPNFPSRALRIVVGFPPGGSSDSTVRLVASALQRQLGKPVLVDNRPGASGAIAAQMVAAARPDGYTLLYATSSSHAIAPHVNDKLGYDPVRDFTPIALAGRAGLVLTANKDLPVHSVAELVRYARQHPTGTLTYASPGQASSQHLALVMFSQVAGIQMRHVPYKGSAPGLMDLIGGQVDLMIDNITAPLPFIRDGKIRALAVTSAERAEMLPEVPTMAESGFPGFDVQAWGGIMAPAGVPPALTERLNREVNLALADPAVQKSMRDAGSVPQGGSSADFGAFVARESANWKRVIDAAGIKGD